MNAGVHTSWLGVDDHENMSSDAHQLSLGITRLAVAKLSSMVTPGSPLSHPALLATGVSPECSPIR